MIWHRFILGRSLVCCSTGNNWDCCRLADLLLPQALGDKARMSCWPYLPQVLTPGLQISSQFCFCSLETGWTLLLLDSSRHIFMLLALQAPIRQEAALDVPDPEGRMVKKWIMARSLRVTLSLPSVSTHLCSLEHFTQKMALGKDQCDLSMHKIMAVEPKNTTQSRGERKTR